MLPDGISRFIGGSYQKSVKGLFHSDLFPCLDPHIGIRQPVNAVHRFIGIGDDIIQRTVFHSDEGGQYFGYAGGVKLVMYIFFIENRAGVGFHQNSGLGTDERPCGPVFPFIGFHGHLFTHFGFLLEAVSCGSRCCPDGERNTENQCRT